MRNFSWIVLTVFFFLLPGNLQAVPAYPGVVDFKQPDNRSLSVRLFGDEFFHWAETVDGYAILFNERGYYEYAAVDALENLVPSGVRANNIAERTLSELNLLSTARKNLKFSPSQVKLLKQISRVYTAEQQKVLPTTGPRKLVCILMEFTDVSFTKTQADFDNLFNQVGYGADGATGSVKDYYLENSWGQLTLDVTVTGPYTAEHDLAYYGGNDAQGNDLRPRDLVTEAVNLADPDVNYADFDNDSDGSVDGVYVIFAGYGEEAGASTDAIWSHAWAITTVTLDGKDISRYSCSPELRGNTGTGLTRIGVISHEFGHVLGAPDFYDTNYSTGGQYSGTGNWDLMAVGSWNNSGATPAHHNAFTKSYYYNWTSMVELTSNQVVTVPNIEDNQAVYFYSTPSTNEYWLLENRQQTGFDAALPGHGLVIYHVDQNNVDAHDPANDINATHPQYMYPVCAGASTDPSAGVPTSYGVISSGGCPFPGTSSSTEFSDITTPSSIDWSGQLTDKFITNIAESGGVIYFDFDNAFEPANFTATSVSTSQIDLSWDLNGAGDDVLVAWSPDGSFGTPVDRTYSAGDSISGGGIVLDYGANTFYMHTALSSSTTYYYKAWSYDGTYYSAGTMANATTVYGVVTSFPYSTDFETGVLPACWSENHGSATTGWTVGSAGSSNYWTIPSHSSYYAYVNDDACNCDMSDVWLISGSMDFSRLSSASLQFDSYADRSYSAGVFTIKASVNGGSDWVDIAAISPSANWVTKIVDLSSLVGNSKVVIAFHYNDEGASATGWAIDNVGISGSPTANTGFLPAIQLLLLSN